VVPQLRMRTHMNGPRPASAESGFSLAELLAVVAIVGIVTAVTLPAFLTYSQAAKLKGGAQELASILNRGRQVAITTNTSTCVLQGSSKVRFRIGTCTGTIWTGLGTDTNGWFTLTDGLPVSAATANVVFTQLGTASTAGTFTVQNPANNKTMHVIVALSGRVTIGP